MTTIRNLMCIFLAALSFVSLDAIANEGDQLYRVATVRAAPGSLASLLEWALPRNTDDFYLMRHSQGDQWDLLFLIPQETLNLDDVFADVSEHIAFHEDNFAYGPESDEVQRAYNDNAMYHIEMFYAVAGKKSELVNQRRMENRYLDDTGQVTNMIFVSAGGSDVDVFTIGFHKDLLAFATPSGRTAEESEAAAKAAGFKDRADLSFYLRTLLLAHHDTLAVKPE